MATWNPIEAIKKKYPDMGLSDAEIYQRLQDPAKFRAAFPEYDVTDDEIKTNMQKVGLSRPDLQAPPSLPNSAATTMHGEKFSFPEAMAYGVSNPKRALEAIKVGMQQTERDLQDTADDGYAETTVKTLADGSLGAMKALGETGVDVVNLGIKGANKVGADIDTIEAEALKPTSTAQVVGGVAESVAEFVLGDAALKSASWFQKAEKAISAANKVKSLPPVLQKAVSLGIDAMRQGAVGGAQEFVHSEGDVESALKTGAITGGIGMGVGVLGEGIGAAADKLGSLAKKAKAVTDASYHEGQGFQRSGAIKDLYQTAREVSEEATGGVPKNFQYPSGGPASVRSAFEEVADHVHGKAKNLFGLIDEATENQLNPVQNELRNLARQLRTAEEGEVAGLLKRKAELEAKQESLFALAKSKGVDPKVLDDARAAYKQASALDDVDRAVKLSTKGMRPELANGSADMLTPETVDPKMLLNRLNKLYDSGRLQQAFGNTPAGQAHIQNLMRVLDLAQQPKQGSLLGSLARSLAAKGVLHVGGGLVGYHEGGLTGGLIGVVAGGALGKAPEITPLLWQQLMMSPGALTVLRRGMETGASANKVIPAVVATLTAESRKQEAETRSVIP